MKTLLSVACISLFCIQLIQAGVGTYPPAPLKHRLTIRYVVTETQAGARATDFGTTAQYSYIENEIGRILSQSGIEVEFQPGRVTWVSDYAYEGSISDTGNRTTGDLNWIFNNIPESYYDLNEGIVSVVFCKRPPGWAERGYYQTNGYAFIGWNGVTFYLGAGMLENNGNMDIVAAVLAHEIGHNFGLRHVSSTQNLMYSTITQGYLENDQTTEVINERFDVGILAQMGLPDIKWNRLGGSSFSLHHLRSTSPIEFTSASALPTGLMTLVPTILENGVFKSDVKNTAASPMQVFLTQEASTPSNIAGGISTVPPLTQDRNPHRREGIACGAEGHSATR